jgi:hypothetical protein
MKLLRELKRYCFSTSAPRSSGKIPKGSLEDPKGITRDQEILEGLLGDPKRITRDQMSTQQDVRSVIFIKVVHYFTYREEEEEEKPGIVRIAIGSREAGEHRLERLGSHGAQARKYGGGGGREGGGEGGG